MIFFTKKGYRQLHDYTWTKRIIFIAIIALVLFVSQLFINVPILYVTSVLAHVFILLVLFGAKIQEESLVIGLKLGCGFLFVSIGAYVQSFNLDIIRYVPFLLIIIFSLIVSTTLPRVKLGLKRVRKVNDFRYTPVVITLVYLSFLFYFNRQIVLYDIAYIIGLILFFYFTLSVFSPFNYLVFILFVLLPWIGYSLHFIHNEISVLPFLLGILCYILFIVLQKSIPPRKKKEK